VDDQDKHLTEAEKQIRRLQSLRQGREETSKASDEKAFLPSKTQAAKIEDRLRAMRRDAERPAGKSRRVKIEGKQKSSKLTFVQIKVLEQLLAQDKRLRGSTVTRIALNRFLNIDNTAEENELESRINEILRQIKSKS
jgi:hypothetical protein